MIRKFKTCISIIRDLENKQKPSMSKQDKNEKLLIKKL
jgi:hypothetical protein